MPGDRQAGRGVRRPGRVRGQRAAVPVPQRRGEDARSQLRLRRRHRLRDEAGLCLPDGPVPAARRRRAGRLPGHPADALPGVARTRLRPGTAAGTARHGRVPGSQGRPGVPRLPLTPCPAATAAAPTPRRRWTPTACGAASSASRRSPTANGWCATFLGATRRTAVPAATTRSHPVPGIWWSGRPTSGATRPAAGAEAGHRRWSALLLVGAYPDRPVPCPVWRRLALRRRLAFTFGVVGLVLVRCRTGRAPFVVGRSGKAAFLSLPARLGLGLPGGPRPPARLGLLALQVGHAAVGLGDELLGVRPRVAHHVVGLSLGSVEDPLGLRAHGRDHLLALGPGAGQLGLEGGASLHRLVLDGRAVVGRVCLGLRLELFGLRGGLVGHPAGLLLRGGQRRVGLTLEPVDVILDPGRLRLQLGPTGGRGTVLLGPPRGQYRLEVPDRLVVLQTGVADDAFGFGALCGDALLGVGADRRGLVLGQRQDLADPFAEMTEGGVGGDRGGAGGPLAGLDEFELKLLYLGGQCMGLGEGLVTLGGYRRALGFQQADAFIDLIGLVSTEGEFEVSFRRQVFAEREQVSAVRHGTILTRNVPSRRPSGRRDGTLRLSGVRRWLNPP